MTGFGARACAVVVGAALTFGDAAQAQEAPAVPAGPAELPTADDPAAATAVPVEVREGVEAFDQAYFALYNPVTALDMVRRVPGFQISGGGGGGGGFNFDGGQRRGFAANATNVLINGQRPSSKTGIEDQLDRISAANVVRLELLRGAALANVDVRGQTQIVNVVLAPGASLGATTTYIAELRYGIDSERVAHELQLNRAQRLFGGDVAFNLRLPSDQEFGEQTETVRDVDGDVVEVRDEFNTRDRYPIEVSGSGTWTPTGRDTFNINAEYQTWSNQQDFNSRVFDGAGALNEIENRVSQEKDAYDSELGGDWERVLSDSVTVKVLGLVTQRDNASTTFEDVYSTTAFTGSSVLASQNTSGERIGRGTLTWRANAAHTIETGGEVAFNTLDSAFDLDIFGPTDTLLLNIADDTRVEELRGELFVADVWTLSPRLTVESGFTFEASRISQIRDDGEPYEREFTYPKPRVTATYALASGDQFRFRLERDVGQLNFQEFATQVNLGDDRTESGNPELEPEQAWKSSIQWERRFGARGALTLEGFYETYEDKQDRVPIFLECAPTPPPNALCPPPPLDGAGNLGDGRKYGVRADATIPLDFMFIPNGELRLRGARSMSEVEDGVTGETRMFSGDNEWFYNVDFRQDIQAWSLAWGAGFNRDGIRENFRATEIHRFGNVDGFLTVFVETTKIPGVTVRFQVENANDSHFYRRRSMWRQDNPDPVADPDLDADRAFERARDTGAPDFTEVRDREMSPVFSVRLSGAF